MKNNGKCRKDQTKPTTKVEVIALNRDLIFCSAKPRQPNSSAMPKKHKQISEIIDSQISYQRQGIVKPREVNSDVFG